MLNFLHMKLTDRGSRLERNRKVRLYVVALCREVYGELPWGCRVLTEIADQRADGEPARVPLPHPLSAYTRQLQGVASDWMWLARSNPQCPHPTTEYTRWETEFIRLGYEKPTGADDHLHGLNARRFYSLALLVDSLDRASPSWSHPPQDFHSVPLLREIAGDPYQRVKFKPEWRTNTVLGLARAMYESREFGAMPILADALQDAGCNIETVLTHCRDTSLPHVRGCWVADLVLGKE
jgi:hypothetical protein